MEDNIIIEEVEFSQELYEKNILENDFSSREIDGIGDEENADN
jgi:hypothetical protein